MLSLSQTAFARGASADRMVLNGASGVVSGAPPYTSDHGGTMSDKQHNELQRSLKNRHIQMIALGGAIGTGLFYGSAHSIGLAGPSIILAYLIAGTIIFWIMRMMGEMSTEEPVAGAFSAFAYKYWGDFPGFLSGWNYWFLYIFVSMAELSVVGIYINYWLPNFPQWLTALVILVSITAVNLD